MIQMSSKSKAEPNKRDGKQKRMDNRGLKVCKDWDFDEQTVMKFENMGNNILRNNNFKESLSEIWFLECDSQPWLKHG